MSLESSFQIELERLQDYEFKVKFDWPETPEWLMDEASPLGAQHGPNASRVLAAAVANCLSASLLFCLQKSRLETKGMKTKATVDLIRNEQQRLRIGQIKIDIDIESGTDHGHRLDRCTQLFEDFCVVTASIRNGIPIKVIVTSKGATIYESD